MKSFRVWESGSKEYSDVQAKDVFTVMNKVFGRSKKLSLQIDNIGTMQVLKETKQGGRNVLGRIREL